MTAFRLPSRPQLLIAGAGVFLAASGLTLWLLGFPCGSAHVDAPNVLLITLDTTRADRLGCYGYEAAHSPALDTLAARGTLFEEAFTSCPQTLPAHATLFTGIHPPEHGLRVNGTHRLDAAIPTLAEVLAERGYATGAFVAAFVLNSKFGLARGFETYDDDLTGAHPQEVPEPFSVYRPGNLVVDAALAWLAARTGAGAPERAAGRRAASRPFFCWVHLYDPHYPYHRHAELAGTALVGQASYDAEVAFLDAQVARLLAFLDERELASRTLVIAVGDHGEGLDDHGDVEHGYLLYEEVLRVPFIVSLPRTVRQGQRVGAMVTLADLAPTVLDLAGSAGALAGGGRSLVPALRGETIPSRPSYAETDLPYAVFGWSALRSLTTPQWKFIRTARPELYDRAADPHELYNLASARPAQVRELEAMLTEAEATMKRADAPTVALTAAERRRLAALGYMPEGEGPRPEKTKPRALKDMKDMLPVKHLATELVRGVNTGTMDDVEILTAARELVRKSPETASFHRHLGVALAASGKGKEAIGRLEEAVRLDPSSAAAHTTLGHVLARQGKTDLARGHFARALRLDPDLALAHLGMGNVLSDRGQLDVAAGHYTEALRLRPDFAEAYYNLANVLVRRRKMALARKHYAEALRLNPDFAAAHYRLGNLLLEQGQPAHAATHYRAVVRLRPDHVDARNNIGVALERQGRYEEAVAQYREALRVDPQFFRPHENLGRLLAAQGQLAAAIGHYREAVRLRPEAPEPASRLAWLLATGSDPELRDGKRAIELAERACELTRRRNPRMLDTLAAAYAEAGHFPEAAKTAGTAGRLARSRGAERLAHEIEGRRRLYEKLRPFRASVETVRRHAKPRT